MVVKQLRYVVREKSTKKYMAEENEIYCDGELCYEIEYAYLWLDDEDAEEYINNILDEPSEFEVARVLIDYDVED